MKELLYSLLLFFSSLGFVNGETLYPDIQKLIRQKNYDKALKEINAYETAGKTDPALSLYQTEIWIEKAGDLYSRKKYKSSFEYYKLAYSKWPSHPIVFERYNELKNQNLLDYQDARIGFQDSKQSISQSKPIQNSIPESIQLHLDTEKLESTIQLFFYAVLAILCFLVITNVVFMILLAKVLRDRD
jgi:tetratricopeptide (TPR) repeat protein